MNLLKLLLDVVIVLLACIAVTIAGLRIAGFKPVLIKSNSMAPELKVNEIAVIREVPYEELSKGDIITFLSSGTGNTTHRIMAIDGDCVITKGDANEYLDINPVFKDSIIGKYYFKIPSSWVITKIQETKIYAKIQQKG